MMDDYYPVTTPNIEDIMKNEITKNMNPKTPAGTPIIAIIRNGTKTIQQRATTALTIPSTTPTAIK